MWFAVDAPFEGTPLIDYAKQQCAKVDQKSLPAWFDSVCTRDYAAPYKGFASLATDFIDRDVAAASSNKGLSPQLSCTSTQFSSHFDRKDPIRKGCITLRSIAERFARGSMCGVSPAGLKQKSKGFSKQSNANWLNDRQANQKIAWNNDRSTFLGAAKTSGHDGFVPFSSCALRTREYKFGPQWAFYASHTNHGDGRCAHGESSSDSTRQPCSWYSARVHQARVLFSAIQSFKMVSLIKGLPSMPSFNYDTAGLRLHIKDQCKARFVARKKKAKLKKPTNGYVDPLVTQMKLNEQLYDTRTVAPPPPLPIGTPEPPPWDPAKQKDDNIRQAARNALFYDHAIAVDEVSKEDASTSTFTLGPRNRK